MFASPHKIRIRVDHKEKTKTLPDSHIKERDNLKGISTWKQ